MVTCFMVLSLKPSVVIAAILLSPLSKLAFLIEFSAHSSAHKNSFSLVFVFQPFSFIAEYVV